MELLHLDGKGRDFSIDIQEPESDGGEEDEKTIIYEDLPLSRLILVMSTAWFGVFLGAADTTVIATLSAPISSEFGSLSLLPWLATAYLISNAAIQPISGRLTDIFGRGRGLVFSNVVFAAGNLLCGVAGNQYLMIFGRLVAGIGGGGLMSIPTFLGSDFIPLRKRGLIGGIANLWYGAGAMTGAVFGGLLYDHFHLGWRLAFLIQVPLSLLSAVFVHFLVKVPPKQSDKSYLKRIDFGGVFLITSCMALLVLGLSLGGNVVPWTHPLPPAAISLSVVLFAAFVRWERTARQPVLPVQLLVDRTVLTSCLASVFCAGIALTSVFYVPLYLQVRGDSATSAGLKIMPASLGTSFGALASGYMVKRTGTYVRLVIGSTVALIVGTTMFALQNGNSPPWLTSAAFLIVGSGYNAVFTITQVACLAAVEHSHQAVVTSSTYLARSLGSTVGVAVASVVYQSSLSAGLARRLSDQTGATEAIERILDDISVLQDLPREWQAGVTESFMDAFRYVWFVMLGWAFLALICIAPIKQHKLHTTLERQ
ncbi:major facilitator superfamily domain-containing protein [Chaetomidium leptoderma]|uniref:Major facilitator superfamily domain-containing protein n=1 Tax=Chaetomidium leptoderma TaxID=669021 RepID=A0AAN6VC84_9PEZI|nr:major facilitator superfamily domain-containing protein [Chaetomidium leptoderma]